MASKKQQVVQTLMDTGVVAVIRIDDPSDLYEVSCALRDGGVKLVEITMTVPGALDIISSVSGKIGEDVFIGAGTVLDGVTARMAILAGASYIVGPSFDREVVDVCSLYDIAVMPGALTPTEIVTAWKAGADVVKIFPGRVGTPGYFQDIKGPLPMVKLMPTGNVDTQTAPEYIKAGAVGVGVGKALVDIKAVKAKDFKVITENAKMFRKIVDEARGGK
ncbi:MAG: bifunctional 4-hydroxy-2-oxoglutarate aldolase/2-dehydro-3-deoxy-phosphogluconate aldolase [Armatimonadetes bacterium]|nr:bifunctional 4-hydroxy-2-oxoglutarate aldolase/2-dehydro-3-deoxy-phosphogluconate aldolase [Armatimonadota bacterium]